MSHPSDHPAIPADALARRARLQATLRDMEAVAPSREQESLRGLRAFLQGRLQPDLEATVEMIVADESFEEAVEIARAAHRAGAERTLVEQVVARLAPLAARAQQRRTARWQLDTRRTLIRCAFSKEDGAIEFDDGDLHVVFLQAFRLEGLPLALDLGKRPRPLLTIGLPLASGIGGRKEWLDAVLRQEPLDDPPSLVAGLNQRLPEGLRIHGWDSLPGFASPVADLAVLSHWHWPVPTALRQQVAERVVAFQQVSQWAWNRGASKSDAPLDLRELIPELRWEGGLLSFATRMGATSAMNPIKMLGAALKLDSADIQGVVRSSLDLRPDPRLDKGERYQPKLKNMYEDAVLLGGGSNIILVDEDDDEPLHLGPPAGTT